MVCETSSRLSRVVGLCNTDLTGPNMDFYLDLAWSKMV